jgi:hypothetical protein
MTAMMKINDISDLTGWDKTDLYRWFAGSRKISWTFAEWMEKQFPEKTAVQWRGTPPEELKAKFDSLEIHDAHK